MGNESDRIFFYDIPENNQESRLDLFLSLHSTDLSRSRIQALIKSGNIKVNNQLSKPGRKLRSGDHISLSIPPPTTMALEPETVEFKIIHEDDSLIVLNKPPGVVVHPAPGHATGTLVHGLLKHCSNLSGIGGELRPGIVHRLDKDTSGVMVVAKNDHAHHSLAGQFSSGAVTKQYIALVHGPIKKNEGRIDLPIGRNPRKRKEMTVIIPGGRKSLTLWKKLKDFQSGFSLLSISLKTGRTHQIRVHFSHMGHPVMGDTVYGYSKKWQKNHPISKNAILPSINRQMLHAKTLGFTHPTENRYLEFTAPLPDDIEKIIEGLNKKP